MLPIDLMLIISDINRAASRSLLPLVKQQVRVTFDDDDATLTGMTMRAIGT
jgi:hypothetical protein